MAGKYRQDNAASVRGLVLRVTQLDATGAPIIGSPGGCDSFLASGFVSFSFTPSYTEADEISITNAAGEVCVYYKPADTLQSVEYSLELCDPNPILTQLLVGGTILLGDNDDPAAPGGTDTGDQVAVGYAAPSLGTAPNPNGVAIEVWTQAILGGKAASGAPYWHYLFPFSTFKMDGDRVLENGNVATVFAGRGVGNASFGAGPLMDFTGVTPAPTATDFQWEFPAVTDRAFAYARSVKAPVGLNGAFATKAATNPTP